MIRRLLFLLLIGALAIRLVMLSVSAGLSLPLIAICFVTGVALVRLLP